VIAGEPQGVRFLCTPGGAIARGRRRLSLLLLALALALVLAGGFAWATGRRATGVLVLALALVPWTAWRMSGDLEPLWLEVEPGARPAIVIQMRRRRERFPLDGAAARRLTGEEIAHLATLATSGGVAAGSGGFDSRLLGEIDLYASDLAHAVLLEVGGEVDRRLVVTPDDPDAFLGALGPLP